MTTLYATLAQLKADLGITDSTRDTLLTLALTAASAGINDYCNRPHGFTADSSATARTYDPRGRTVPGKPGEGDALMVHDISETVALVVEIGVAGSASWTTVTTLVEPRPLNAIVDGKPITQLLYIGRCWPAEPGRVRVTAKWGWPAIPDAVVTAAIRQASRLFRRKDSPEGVTGTADWGGIRVPRVDPDVAALLESFVQRAVG